MKRRETRKLEGKSERANEVHPYRMNMKKRGRGAGDGTPYGTEGEW
jgi:hypothetical protein